jgi:hypothetical protein
MKFVKPVLMVCGGLLVGLTLPWVAPRAVHAAAATLVEITNTTDNPAVTQDISKDPSQIVHLTTLGKAIVSASTLTQLHQYFQGGTFGPPFVVPVGKSFVITSIEASVLTAGDNFLNLYDNTTIGQREYWYLPNVGLTQLQFPSGLVYQSGTPVYVYIGGASPSQMVVDVHGYLTTDTAVDQIAPLTSPITER